MQPSYDADDFMRRGFFGSLIGFRKRSSSKTEPVAPPPPPKFGPPITHHQPEPVPGPIPCSSGITVGHPVDSQLLHPPQQLYGPAFGDNRTEYEIYREIVSEAEYIERSPLTTPDFSTPTTPQPPFNYPPPPQQHHISLPVPVPLPPQQLQQQPLPIFEPNHQFDHLMPQNPADMMHHQYHMVMSPLAPHPIPVDTNGVPLGTQCPMAPPPYSSFAPQSSTPMDQMGGQQMANLPFDVKREIQEHLVLQTGKQQMSIEDIVKLVVVALKDSQIEESREEESPEEILRRKRIQNNLAAARYRKRQREAKECAEQELGDLVRRNDELRDQVVRMEMEISQLKQAVLGRQ